VRTVDAWTIWKWIALTHEETRTTKWNPQPGRVSTDSSFAWGTCNSSVIGVTR